MVSPFYHYFFLVLVVYIYAYLGETFKAPSIVLFCVGGKKKKKKKPERRLCNSWGCGMLFTACVCYLKGGNNK